MRTKALIVCCALVGCGTDPREHVAGAPHGTNHDPTVTGGPEEDAGAQAWQPPEVHFPEPSSQAELRLSELGLYVDIETKELAPDLIAFEPRYALWSDGADKRRWLRLPEGARIDNSDPDHWQFPVGSVLFKEFSRAGRRLETRVIARVAGAVDATFMGTFLWQDDERDAVLVRDGASDVLGTDHDLPTDKNCRTCHEGGEPGRILGFSAVQLAEPLPELFTQTQALYEVPGAPESAAGLGYLHANCAHCHNPLGTARSRTDMNLRLSVADVEAGKTTLERETVGVMLESFTATSRRLRVAAGEPEQSGLLERMSERGSDAAMPSLGTKHVDPQGMASVRAWIAALAR